MAKYWKLGDRYAYIDSKGSRGIVKTLAKAKQLIGSKTSRSNPKKGGKKRKMAKKKKGKRRGKGFLGNMGIKGLAINTAVVTGMKYIIRRFAPQLQPVEDPVALMGAGALGHITGTGKSLLQAGMIDLGSDFLSNLLSGQGFSQEGVGGYDF